MKRDAVAVVDDQDMEVLPPDAEPSWERARALIRGIGKGAEAIIRLGEEIKGLRKQFFNQGGSGKFTVRDRGVPNREDSFPRNETGWRAKVEEELGICAKTALRLIERGLYTELLTEVAAGNEVEYQDTKKDIKRITPTPEMQQMAKSALVDVTTGVLNPSRAWAGIAGEGTRRAAGGTASRAAVDHAKNILKAFTSLKTSLPKWKKLSPEERAEIELEWESVRKLIPDTWNA
jgi:hypothetical protein